MSPLMLESGVAKTMVSMIGRYTLETVLGNDQRAQHSEQCKERLRRNEGRQVQQCAERAVLANLNWGLDALEEAIRTTNADTKRACLDHAEKLLQVCALFGCEATTPGVANSYLSALAHLNLAVVWKLLGDDHKVAAHMLDMFFVDPLHSRVDFAPDLWEHLFLPHLSNVVNWYTEQRQSIVRSENVGKVTDEYGNSRSPSRNFSANYDELKVNVFTLSASQMSQLQALEKLYQDSLDQNTRQFVRYYKEWLNYDSASANSKSWRKPLLPTAEPPMVNVREEVILPSVPMVSMTCQSTSSKSQTVQAFSPGRVRRGLLSIEEPNSPGSDFLFEKFEKVWCSQPTGENSREESVLERMNGNSKITLDTNTDSAAQASPESIQPLQSMVSLTPNRGRSVAQIFTLQESSSAQLALPATQKQHKPQCKQDGGVLSTSSGYVQSGNPNSYKNSPECLKTSQKSNNSKSNSASTSPSCQSRDAIAAASLSFNRAQMDANPPGRTEICRLPSKDSTAARMRTISRSGFYDMDMGMTLKNSSFAISNRRVFGKNTISPPPFATAYGRRSISTDESSFSKTEEGARVEGQSLATATRRSNKISSGGKALRFQSRYANDHEEEMQKETTGRSMSDRFDSTDNESDDRASMVSAASPATLQHPLTASCADGREQQNDHAETQVETGINYKHCRHVSVSSSVSDIRRATPYTKPPKDFLCPITNQLFSDPVTLETGQTYDRKAIQEWLNRGHRTCPITRQTLVISALPNTNYVLKRVIDSWKEQNPELALEFCSSAESPLLSPDSGGQQDSANGGSPIRMRTSRSRSDAGRERSPSPSPPCALTSLYEDTRWPIFMECNNNSSRRTQWNHDDRNSSSLGKVDELLIDSRLSINRLCTSKDSEECESMVLVIARTWQKVRGDTRLVTCLSTAGASDALMKVLMNATSMAVLRATLYLLSGLIEKDDSTRQTILRLDPTVTSLTNVLRKGVTMAVVLVYQLKLQMQQLILLDLLPLLALAIKQSDENKGAIDPYELQLVINPKSAAIMLLEQIVTSADYASPQQSAHAIIVLQALPALITSLESEDVDERIRVVSLLLQCIHSDERSRHLIIQLCNLTPVVDLLHSGNNSVRTLTISFLSELVHLPRRTSCEVLRAVKRAGPLSSMHMLLLHLHISPIEQKPVAAGLLLQLDLLEEPRKRSMYREEAVESLVEALVNMENVTAQTEAAKTFVSLGGRFSYSGRPLMEKWLLKSAGLEESLLGFTEEEQDCNEPQIPDEEEENMAKLWEKRITGALVGHEVGTLIKALGQGMQSKNPEVSKRFLILATWLTHLLPVLPDTGIRQAARGCLLDRFVGVLQTSKDLPQRALSALAIHSFLADPGGIDELLSYAKDFYGSLRQLRKYTWIAEDILRAFHAHASLNAGELLIHAEQNQVDTSRNGEVRCLGRATGRIFSGHSDGTIKVWDVRERSPVLIQEMKEHSKSVTSLAVSVMADRIYSGSLDKTIRVWALGEDKIHSLHIFDLKDAIMGLVVNGPMACIIPQGAGIKVQYEETTTKVLNQYKHVQSLAIFDGKIYCGCADNSIQEIDPLTASVKVIQHGVRTLLGKKAVYVVHASNGYLFTAGAPVEGVAGKIWKLSDYSLVGTLSTTAEIRSMAVSDDFIYLGSSAGVIEVWLRDRLVSVTTMNVGSKVLALMLDGDILYSGSEDGIIRAWTIKCNMEAECC